MLNTVNEGEGDSTDSEGEIEESEDEDNKFVEAESEGDSDDLSDEESGEEVEAEEDTSEEDESDGDEDNDNEDDSLDSSSESETEVVQAAENGGASKRKDKKIQKDGKANKSAAGNSQIDSSSKKNNAEDEYKDHDTSDEEDIRNTVGNIPMNWYDEYKHLGYDWDGEKIIKPESGDHLDEFLKRMEDPDFWRTVKDPQTGQNVVLSEEDIQLIKRIKGQKIPDANFDEYAVINTFN